MIIRDNSEDSVIDKIVTVCCALCNCCESVIPFELYNDKFLLFLYHKRMRLYLYRKKICG